MTFQAGPAPCPQPQPGPSRARSGRREPARWVQNAWRIPELGEIGKAVAPYSSYGVLGQLGFYQKWHAQIMADIFQPRIRTDNPPETNNSLISHKTSQFGRYSKRSLFLVKEAMRNLGLTSSEKIFNEEAGLLEQEPSYKSAIKDMQPLKPADAFHMEPPMAAQLLWVFLMDNQRNIDECAEDQSVHIRWGMPKALPKTWQGMERLRHDHSAEPHDLDRYARLPENERRHPDDHYISFGERAVHSRDTIGCTPDDTYWHNIKAMVPREVLAQSHHTGCTESGWFGM